MTLFENPWYAGMIERFSPPVGTKTTAEATEALSIAILGGLCILATAVDGLAAAIKDAEEATISDRLRDITLALEEMKPDEK